MQALLVFPHQLFLLHPGLSLEPELVVLTEDPLFFGDKQYPTHFHFQKLALHRASMKHYEQMLRKAHQDVLYLEHKDGASLLSNLLSIINKKGIDTVCAADVVDFSLKKRLLAACKRHGVSIEWLNNPGFLNTDEENAQYRSKKNRWFMADFYKWQRMRLNVLVDENKKPVGGKWSFDKENRKKIPKNRLPKIPEPSFPSQTHEAIEALAYVKTNYPEAQGTGGGSSALLYPHTHDQASAWLDDFLVRRFEEFGPYEDAIVEDQNWLYHGVLTPMLNVGLLLPSQVIGKALAYAKEKSIPMASVEGFVRQIIGWREFMRATYSELGVKMRTTNHWKHLRPMPECFYTASSGIAPIDNTIRRVLDTGYCHHIERLMVLGGFMFLCEINPNAIYQWFMELFVDSYDWVMVPNVYAMSQHADGGLITTKPYFSGSNYIRKMSHYPKGEWCDVWDGLYWRWILKHANALGKNPRWAMMVRTAEKFDDERKQKHVDNAETYLSGL